MNNEHKNTLNRTNKWKNQMNMKFIEFCYQRPAINMYIKFETNLLFKAVPDEEFKYRT